MSFLIIAPGMKLDAWIKQLKAQDRKLEIHVWPDVQNSDAIDFSLCWNHPPGALNQFRHLRCIASMGAGIDHILRDPHLPQGVAVTRIVDFSMSQFMSEYVIWGVLNYCRHFDFYKKKQVEKAWRPKVPLLASRICVGIMGLGQLGGEIAEKLVHIGFPVAGWARTEKNIQGVETFAGRTQLNGFLKKTRILICTLPLTPATQSILNRDTFKKLPRGAYIINVARGDHLVEDDLLDMISNGHLSGACLDVFREEPLPGDHPFWGHPDITVTPHISSITNPKAVAPQIVENYHRMKSGRPLLYQVDIDRGY
jgi:glyoxylate/hydroxypyruvate reductase A